MSLRAKLLLAQLPLALALVLVGVVAMWSVSMLSDLSQLILKDNYRSVLAAERMKESIERLDTPRSSSSLGEADAGRATDRRAFREIRAATSHSRAEHHGIRSGRGRRHGEASRELDKYRKLLKTVSDDVGLSRR